MMKKENEQVFENIIKENRILKGVKNLQVNQMNKKLMTIDVNHNIYLYNLNSLGFSIPKKLKGFKGFNSNEK